MPRLALRPSAVPVALPCVLVVMLWMCGVAGCGVADPGPDSEPGIESTPEHGEESTSDDQVPTVTDPDCHPDVVSDSDDDVVTIYLIESGQIAGLCYGQADPAVEESWDALALVAPPEQLDPVSLFGGFTGAPDTLAYAGPMGQGNSEFVVAVSIEGAWEGGDELGVTMTHELAHVFTQTPDQLDLGVRPADCPTFHNGLGCFAEDSYLWLWIREFWTPAEVAGLPFGGAEIDEPGGEDRCSTDPAFLGPYPASHPEEDLAETFSAFVYDVDVVPAMTAKVEFFSRFPELEAFQDRAAAADLDDPDYEFDYCG